LRRVAHTQLTSDPAGTDIVDTTYDSFGRVASVSNPYRSTSDPSYGITRYGYDALSRLASITLADGSSSTFAYGTGSPQCPNSAPGYPVTATDEAGNARMIFTTVEGAIREVDEPGSSGLNQYTCYTNDSLERLVAITQGAQTRTYKYDMLSRLVSTKQPEETGVCSSDPSNPSTCYTYDADGNVLTRTDARGVTTTYAYNALNQLTSKQYSDGTPVANFWYNYNSATIGNWTQSGLQNVYGRLYATCTSNAVGACPGGYSATVYSYDAMGRVANYWQCTPYNCGASAWEMTYNYDKAGDVASWTHPAGFTITNTINAARQITQIQSNLVDSSHPQYLAQNIAYTPWGAEQTLENGCAGSGCTNILETYAYNNRLQPVMIELGNTSNASANYCLVYNYYAGPGEPTSCAAPAQGNSGNNGNVMGYYYQDNVNPTLGHTATYTYDSLNRLASAVATAGSTYSYTFSYDRYGNMTCNKTQGQCTTLTFPSNNGSTTNQPNNPYYTFDAAGNLTADGTGAGSHTYQWDAEERLISVDGGATDSLTYNALGQKVQWSGYQLLWDSGGRWAGRYYGGWNVSGAFYLGARSLGIYLDQFYGVHVNHLGSVMANTNAAGSESGDVMFYPWGLVWGGAAQDWSFSGFEYEDNTAATLDPTLFRDYAILKGRWLSPDPLGGDVTNPQSLNRYAYALNNPTTFVDPLGLDATGCTQATMADGTQGYGCSGPDSVTVIASAGAIGLIGNLGGVESPPPLIFQPGRSYGGGGGGAPASKSPPKPEVPLNPFATQVFAQVYSNLNFLDPAPCGGGFFGFRGLEGNLGLAKAGAYVIGMQDSQSGSSLGTLVEGGVGPLSVGNETAVSPASGNVESSTLVFLGAGVGAFGGFNQGQIQLGLYGSADVVGGGAYVSLVPAGTCH
jgi:RHS repeat-associated protein